MKLIYKSKIKKVDILQTKHGKHQQLMKFQIVLLCLFFLVELNATPFYFKSYDMEDGLSNNHVTCCVQDDYGFMWFGTRDGLNRFDSKKFYTFKSYSSEKGSLMSSYILDLAKSPTGQIWVSTNLGLQKYDYQTDSFTLIDFTKGNYFYMFGWFVLLAAMGFIVGKLVAWEGMCSGSGIPQVQGEMKGYLNQNWWRVLIAKITGGTLCILGGLSLGREGPSVQLGAMTGKGIAKITKAGATKERYMMTCGSGAGLAAAFNAPLSGVMFSLEEIQKNFNSSMLVCVISGCVASDFISKNVFGLSPVFDFHLEKSLPLTHYWMLILLGILLGLCGAFYNFMMLKGQDFYGKLKNNSTAIPDYPSIFDGWYSWLSASIRVSRRTCYD
mgnify:CR=1 FL=1